MYTSLKKSLIISSITLTIGAILILMSIEIREGKNTEESKAVIKEVGCGPLLNEKFRCAVMYFFKVRDEPDVAYKGTDMLFVKNKLEVDDIFPVFYNKENPSKNSLTFKIDNKSDDLLYFGLGIMIIGLVVSFFIYNKKW